MKNEKVTKHLFYSLLGVILLVLLTRGITYAKYISDAVFNYYLSSKGFYFESEELDTEQNKITDTSWDGEKIYFSLRNNKNKLIASESDIKYEITCTIDEENTNKKCYLNGTTESKVTGNLSASFGCLNETDDKVDTSSYTEKQCENYTWTYVPTKAEHYFEVVDTEGNSVDTATVIITAKSTEPYEKNISAKYVLTKDSSDIGTLSLKYESKESYENIIVTNSYNEDKCLKLTWNSNDISIDEYNTNIISSKTDSNNYINEIIFKLSKKDSLSYTFYKINQEKTFNETDFSLVETTECQ